ncbi:MAG: amidohydrolase family protein [Kiritimatiellae bacterium]|nr:amidohydrolase family protein [Kiritimatiellia bacterium]
MTVVDFHVHAFPDALAQRAMAALEAETDQVKARLDGTIASLLRSMDAAGIDRAVLCSIATKPEQFESILNWSRQIASDRIVPLPSIHPRDPAAAERLDRIAGEGFKGIKLHPYYQDFHIDEEAALPIYEKLQELGLIVVCHTGFDIAFPRIRRADPVGITHVTERFPDLKLVTTHLGAWEDWDEVERHMLGKPIYMELSFSLEPHSRAQAGKLLSEHPMDYLLFGTDSPWTDQAETIQRLRALDLGAARENAILGGNALRLLGESR